MLTLGYSDDGISNAAAAAAADGREPEVWAVTRVPKEVTALQVARAFDTAVRLCMVPSQQAMDALSDSDLAALYTVSVKGKQSFVAPIVWSSLLAAGCTIPTEWQIHLAESVCPVKPRQPSKQERLAKIAAAVEAKAAVKAKQESNRPVWRAELLDQFPRREHTLCQHAQVAQLPAELKLMIENVYMPCAFPPNCPEVAIALKYVSDKYPTALRVKELFETIETFSVIAKQIASIQSRASKQAKAEAKRQKKRKADTAAEPDINGDKAAAAAEEQGSRAAACTPIEHIFDLACGHGLLGCLLGYRFPRIKVVCCDLEKRAYFEHYIEAFRVCGVADQACGEESPLSNVTFIEGDMAEVHIPPRSFIATIHACNEANIVAMQMAVKANAAFAAMPCCIRDGLYAVGSVRHVDDDTRHAAMIGVMAGVYGAHSIIAIDRRISNRHLIVLGGYPTEVDAKKEAKKHKDSANDHARLHNWHGARKEKPNQIK